jgi:hypothetical protein
MRLLLAILVLLAAAPASAGVGGRQQAQAHFVRGRALFMRGRYGAALREFKLSYSLSARPLLLYDIAQAAIRAGARDEALAHFKRFLATIDDSTSERRESERLVAELERGATIRLQELRTRPVTLTRSGDLEQHPTAANAASPPAPSMPAAPETATVTAEAPPAASATRAPAGADAASPPPLTSASALAPKGSPSAEGSLVPAKPAPAERALSRRRGLIAGLASGAVVLVAGAITLGIVLGTSSSPSATLGRASLQ